MQATARPSCFIGSGVHQSCVVATDLFLSHMDWVLNRPDYHAFLGLTIGTDHFTDLDFSNDVFLLSKMIAILVLALEIMNQEAKFLDLQVTG